MTMKHKDTENANHKQTFEHLSNADSHVTLF